MSKLIHDPTRILFFTGKGGHAHPGAKEPAALEENVA